MGTIMRRIALCAAAALTFGVGWLTLSTNLSGQVPGPGTIVTYDGPGGPMMMAEGRGNEFAMAIKGAKEHDGFFKLYQKDDRVLMEIRPDQFNKPFLCPIAVARGGGMGGHTLNFDEQWVLLFKKAGDKVQLVRRNVHFKARPGSPAAKAVETTYTDSVLAGLRIVATNPAKQATLINLNDIFMSDFAELHLGGFDPSRSTWGKVKAFPRNIEMEVQATYSGGRNPLMMLMGGDDGVIDPRGNTVVIHYGLAELPEGGYSPRVADDRVGYFLSAMKDFSSESKDTAFVRYVNRWRLERAEGTDPKNLAKLSVPKKSIKFYIEKTVPHEYRAIVQEGILEWNKAFEKIGYRNAIEVVQQRDDEDWDPEDMNYNTFRWITTGHAFAMGPSRANPLTGEILDADIIFDADLVRMWKSEQQLFRGPGATFEPASPIQAMDQGWGLDHQLLNRLTGDTSWNDLPKRLTNDPTAARLWAIQQGVCQCGSQMKYELGMAAMAIMAGENAKPGDKVPDDLINQAIKSVVMHEVGHTLGLRHNFKGSTMLPNDQLHDTKITREKGLVGSVMDYVPVNLAPKGTKQGDYFTTTIGPYDYWAIEYAYKPISGNEADELKKIANKIAQPGLDYGTDEDTFLTPDPLINRGDLGADVMRFARERMELSEALMKELSTKIVDDGEGYQRARAAFSILLAQYGNGAYLISKYVGGEHAHRDHRGDPNGRDPLVVVAPAKQREALKFLQEHTFGDKAFQFPPELLRRLAVERWTHWGVRAESTDFPLNERILEIQKVALNQLLSPAVMRRVLNNAQKASKDDQPLTLAEVFRSVTDGVWAEPENGDKPTMSVVRRNLQREHVKKLSAIALGQKAGRESGDMITMIMMAMSGQGSPEMPSDARSLARAHLRDVNKRIQTILGNRQVDETTQAHLEECRERIAKVLDASMQWND
jgi:hypothetical protein